jgi:predicted nucleotidyltransferase
MKATIEDIRELAKQIALQFHPQKVILFGSHAEGQATEESDADLLVIMNTQERTLRQAARIAGAIPHPFPIDILVRTPAQIKERLNWGDSFLRSILEKGIVLYEASDSGVEGPGQKAKREGLSSIVCRPVSRRIG